MMNNPNDAEMIESDTADQNKSTSSTKSLKRKKKKSAAKEDPIEDCSADEDPVVNEDQVASEPEEMSIIDKARAAKKAKSVQFQSRTVLAPPKVQGEPNFPTIQGIIIQIAVEGKPGDAMANRSRIQLLVTDVRADGSQLMLGPEDTADGAERAGTEVAIWPVCRLDAIVDPNKPQRKKAGSGGIARKDRVMQENPVFGLVGAVVSISCSAKEALPPAGSHVQCLAVEPSVSSSDHKMYYATNSAPVLTTNKLSPYRSTGPAEKWEDLFVQAQWLPSLAKSISDTDQASISGIEHLMTELASGSAGQRGLALLEERRNGLAIAYANQLDALAGPEEDQLGGLLTSSERNRDEKREFARDQSAELRNSQSVEDSLPVSTASRAPKCVVLYNGAGYDAVGWGDDERAQRIGAPASNGRQASPNEFVMHSITNNPPPELNALESLLTVSFNSTYVIDAKTAAIGEQADPIDISGTIVGRFKASDEAGMALHAAKLGIARLATLCDVRFKECTTAFVKTYFEFLPQLHILKAPSPPRPAGSSRPVEPEFPETSIYNMPSVIRRFGIEVSEKWALEYISGSQYFRAHDEIGQKDKMHATDLFTTAPTFETDGFSNLLEVAVEPEFLRETANKAGCSVKYMVLLLGESPLVSAGKSDTEKNEKTLLEKICGSGAVTPLRTRKFFRTNAMAYALMA